MSTTDLTNAIRSSLQTEKNAMDFYRFAALQASDPGARHVLELLAREERSHAASFFEIYDGDDIANFDSFVDAVPDHTSEWLAALERQEGKNFREQQAMELALHKEAQLEEALRALARSIEDPHVRAVYERNALETHNHYLLIEAEYARLMGMVDEADMDTYVRE